MKLPFFTLFSIVLLSGCAAIQQKKWLGAHRASLDSTVASNKSEEEKMDDLMANYVQLMQEGLRFTNPKKGVKYITKYQHQNSAAIESIVSGSQNWVTNLNAMQKIGLAARIAGKPWLKDFVLLAPKFKRRYEQYKFILEMTGKVSRGFGNIGGKVLGL